MTAAQPRIEAFLETLGVERGAAANTIDAYRRDIGDFRHYLERTRTALGDGQKKVHPSEASPILKMGKKIVAARSMPAGQVLTADDLALKSPGDGLPPYELENVIGQTLVLPVNEDDEITFQILKPTPELARK